MSDSKEAKEVFNDRIKEVHIQREEVTVFNQLCQEGKAISGLEKEECETLLKDLDNDNVEYSNDMVIDMILDYVIKSTSDLKLKEVLENIKVANISSDDSIIGRAYPKYFDGSYYIEIGRNFERRIRLLSDIFAVLFMLNEKLEVVEYLVLHELLNANMQRFSKNEENNNSYNRVQLNMMYCDKMIGNNFSDKYITYASEIQEISTAFFVGHEIGHHYYGHTEQDSNSTTQDKTKELMADRYGIGFAFDYLESAYANSNRSYGIHQFAGIFIPLIVSAYLCDDIFEDKKNHPSIAKRLRGVQMQLQKLLDKAGYQEVEKYIFKLYEIIGHPKIIFEN